MGNLVKSLIALYYWNRLNKASKIFNSSLGAYSKKTFEQSPRMKSLYIGKLIKLKKLDYVEAFEFRNKVATNMNKKWRKYWKQASLEQKV